MEKNNYNCLADIFYDMQRYGVSVYGAGKRGRQLVLLLKDIGYNIKMVVDKIKGKRVEEFVSINIEDISAGDSSVCVISPRLSNDELEDIKLKISEYFLSVVDMDSLEIMIKKAAKNIDSFRYLVPDIDEVMNYNSSRPFNHYESPFSNRKEYEFSENWWGGGIPEGVNLNTEVQLEFIPVIKKYANELFDYYSENKCRYHSNDMFGKGCARVYYSMIRHYKPKRIIEVGCGFSTAIALDALDKMEDYKTHIKCIEPFPERLLSIMKDGDEKKIDLIEDYIQNVSLKEFDCLEENDILFIDSSHVLKSGGDLVREYLQILPRLNPGVLIHIHDIFYPFRYLSSWVARGIPYTEAYLLHALLMDNSNYEILFWPDYIGKVHSKECRLAWGDNIVIGPGSFWMEKIKK